MTSPKRRKGVQSAASLEMLRLPIDTCREGWPRGSPKLRCEGSGEASSSTLRHEDRGEANALRLRPREESGEAGAMGDGQGKLAMVGNGAPPERRGGAKAAVVATTTASTAAWPAGAQRGESMQGDGQRSALPAPVSGLPVAAKKHAGAQGGAGTCKELGRGLCKEVVMGMCMEPCMGACKEPGAGWA